MTVAADAMFVAQRLTKGLAQRDPDILHCVMRIYLKVAHGFDIQIHYPVSGHLIKHVFEKGDS